MSIRTCLLLLSPCCHVLHAELKGVETEEVRECGVRCRVYTHTLIQQLWQLFVKCCMCVLHIRAAHVCHHAYFVYMCDCVICVCV